MSSLNWDSTGSRFEQHVHGISRGIQSWLQFSMYDKLHSRMLFGAELNLEFATRASLREGVLNTKYSIPLFASICASSILVSSLALHCTAFRYHRRHGGSRHSILASMRIDGVQIQRLSRVPCNSSRVPSSSFERRVTSERST